MQDGTILWAYKDREILIMAADINGDAGPNMVGRDTFWFVYSKLTVTKDSSNGYKKCHIGKPGFYMWGENNTREDLMSATKEDNCNKSSRTVVGAHCGALIKLDGWQIKDDYPW